MSRNVGMASGVALGSLLFAWFSGALGQNGALLRTFAVGAALALVGAAASWSTGTRPREQPNPRG